MDSLSIEGTSKTPTVNFNNDILEIKGRSIPEDANTFYRPVLNWIDNYVNTSPSKTAVKVYLEYFNSGSSKCLLDIFKKLDTLNSNGGDVTVNWYYDEGDEDMKETGEDYAALVNITFNLVELPY